MAERRVSARARQSDGGSLRSVAGGSLLKEKGGVIHRLVPNSLGVQLKR